MSEVFNSAIDKPRATPRDLAHAALRRKDTEIEQRPPALKAGDIILLDSEESMLVPELRRTKKIIDGQFVDALVPYTYQQYYAHSFEDQLTLRWEGAPGHDSKRHLHNDEYSMRQHNRTFTQEQLKDLPHNLPDEDALFVRPLDHPDVALYLESSNNNWLVD